MSDPSGPFDLEDFFENGAIPLRLVGPDGTILKANRAELEFLGYTAEEYIGHNITEFHVDQPVIADILKRLLAGEVIRHYEARLRAKDGSIKYVLIDSSGRFRDGEFLHTRCFTRDFTLRKSLQDERQRLVESERAAREEAERLNNAKDEFLTLLSHELRTPLNAVLGWARILEADAASDKVRHAAEVITRNVGLQVRLIEDLLDISRVSAGKLRLDLRPLSLVSVIEPAVETFKPASEAKGVRLETILDSGTAPVYGDPERLTQVVGNLLSNALKFTPKGGRIQVILQRVESHLEIVVADSGAGIDASLLPYVFDRFRQGRQVNAENQGGLGLGLALAKSLVELHGGRITAESPGLNRGAVFTVALPVLATVSSAGVDRVGQPSAEDNAAAARLRGLRVLVVDDEPDSIEPFTSILSQHGAEVRAAGSAAEALRTIHEWPPAIIVSDINMPEEEGYSFMRKVRQEGQGRTIPAIALTAVGRLEDRMKAFSAGFQAYIAKPVEPTELVVIIASLTGRIFRSG